MAVRITLGLILLVVAVDARQDLATPPLEKQFVSGTTAVVVDVVVRDKKGNPVTDLRASDFELLEDGVRQEIGDATLVAPGGAQAASGAGATAPAAADAERRAITSPTFVALVFDRLTPEARAFAHKGAMTYLETFHEDDFAGVFLSDMSLVPIQTYTNDRARLKRAIDEAAPGRRRISTEHRHAILPASPGAKAMPTRACHGWPAPIPSAGRSTTAARQVRFPPHS